MKPPPDRGRRAPKGPVGVGLILALLLFPPPAAAGHDELEALSGVIAWAHDHTDASRVRLMMSEAERWRFDRGRVLDEFERHLFGLGVAASVACAQEGSAGHGQELDQYRCLVQCQRGEYVVKVLMSPPTPAPDDPTGPIPGFIERLWLASALLDRSPWPHFGAGARLWLALLWAAVLALGLRLFRFRPPFYAGAARDRAPLSLGARLLGQELLAARLLTALAAGLLLCLWWCFAPLPLWGRLQVYLAALGMILLIAGLLGLLRDSWRRLQAGLGPARREVAAVHLLLLGLLVPALLLFQASSLGGAGATVAARAAGSYRLPLSPERGPAYVRRAGSLLDLVYLYPDGRSCHGPRPAQCRGFGAEVVAPADGVVAQAVDRYPDDRRDREAPAGNYVLLRSTHGHELALLSHLMSGSVCVRPRQPVRAGERLGRLGNSGDSDEPHLTMELGPALLPPGQREDGVAGAAYDPEASTSLPILLPERAGAPPRLPRSGELLYP